MRNVFKWIYATITKLIIPILFFASQADAHGYKGKGEERDFEFKPGTFSDTKFHSTRDFFSKLEFDKAPDWNKPPTFEEVPGFIRRKHFAFSGHHHTRSEWGHRHSHNPVPLPAGAVLMASALAGLVGIARSRKQIST